MEILMTDSKSQKTKKIADHSRIETQISKNFTFIVMDGSGSFLFLQKVMIIKVGKVQSNANNSQIKPFSYVLTGEYFYIPQG